MVPPSTYTATCWRDGSAWVVHIPELGRSARAARLSQVEGVARNLVATFAEEQDAAGCRVVVDLVVRHSTTELLAAAAAARADSDRVSVEAVTLRRGLARQLAAEGFDVRDVAALLGLSYRRALQLIGDAPHLGWAGRPQAVPARTSAARLDGPLVPSPRRPAEAGRLEPTGGGERPDAPAPPLPAQPHRRYRHEAVLYHGGEGFLAATEPFVREGVALGQPVMVAIARERLERLREALGPAGDQVYWVDMAELGANPARIIPAWRQFVDEHADGAAPVRGVGEPIWAGRRPAEIAECQLHEALLNVALEADTPLWLRCPYDEDSLDRSVLEEAARSHPCLVDAQDEHRSPRYGGAQHVDALFSAGLPPPPLEVEDLVFDEEELAAVRQLVLQQAAHAHLEPSRSADLALAVAEAATNSVRHGGGRGELRTWQEDGALVCEVRDDGSITDPMTGRRLPPVTDDGGRGLWLVNQLSDLVQIRSGSDGSAVRISTWL